MDKDKSEINSAATDRQECDRQLRAMGFDVENRPDSHNEDDAEDAGMLVDSVIGCLGFVFQEINDAESFSGEDFYKLTRDENEIFNKLPEWHRELFIHFPGEWSVTEKIFEEKNLKNKNLSVNQLLIKCSLKAILAGDEVACYLWDLSEDMKEIDCMSDEMDLREISAVVFPLYAYQGIAEDFERSAVRAFRKERISIDELGRKVGYSLELADIGVLVNQIWKRYLDDKKEYIGMYRQSVMNTVFNNKKSEPDAMTPPPPPYDTPHILDH